MIDNQTSVLKVSKRDLEDPEVHRLNQVIGHLQAQINSLRQDAIISGNLKADSITTKLTDGVPADTDVVAWGTIKKYLSPAAQRQALIKNVWLGTPVRPVVGTTNGLISAVVDTHTNRLAIYFASGYEVGSLYYETDRTSLYQVQLVSGVNTWVWIAGDYSSAFSNRPTDLGTTDTGFIFTSTTADALYTYRWDGSAWAVVNEFAETDTLAKYGSSAGDYSTLTIERSRGSISSPTAVSSGDIIGDVIFKAFRNSAFRDAASIHCSVEATPTASTAAGKISIYTVDTAGSALTERWAFTANGNIIPIADNAYDIGSTSLKPKKIWTNAFNMTGGTNGYVLTSDASGNASWAATVSGNNTYLTANANATDTLTTSFADLSNCSLSLNVDGFWLVIGQFQFYKDINDDECQGVLVFDGTTQIGGVRLGCSTAAYTRGMQTRAWIVGYSGGPKTAKLQAKKVSGTGASTSENLNTSITAIYLYT